jgi:hypothetical protein
MYSFREPSAGYETNSTGIYSYHGFNIVPFQGIGLPDQGGGMILSSGK